MSSSRGYCSLQLCTRSAGKRLFGEALAASGMEGFFPLIEQFRCGRCVYCPHFHFFRAWRPTPLSTLATDRSVQQG